MALPTDLQSSPHAGQQRRRLVMGIILGAIIVHVIGGIGAGIWIVAKYFAPPPATFEVRKDLRLDAKERSHKMNMAEFDALTPKPTFNDTLASLRPTDFALPDLPNVPVDQMLPLDPSELMADQVASLVGTSGMGGAGEGMGGDGGLGGGFSFLGIQSDAKRVILLFDVSSSVVNKAASAGMPLDLLKAETKKLIDTLSISTRFNLVQFTQNYQFFQPDEPVPASDPNKELGRQWVDNEWTDAGTMSSAKKGVVSNQRGLVEVLERAFAQQPDAIFLISDGSFQWRAEGNIGDIPYREIQQLLRDAKNSQGQDIVLHFIGFAMDSEDRSEWSKLSRRTGGKFREIKQ